MVERPDLKSHKDVESWIFWSHIRSFIGFLCWTIPLCWLCYHYFIEGTSEEAFKITSLCIIYVVVMAIWFFCMVNNKAGYSVAEIVVASKYRSDLENTRTIDMDALYGYAYILTQGGETFIVDEFVFDKLEEFEFYYVVYYNEHSTLWDFPYKHIVKILDLHKNSLEV